MKYKWIDEFLLGKQGVTKDLKEEWNWIRYMIGGKLFAAICLDENDEPFYITLKLEPMEGEFLRSQYEDIIPGYYMNKQHWNSVKAEGAVPDELLQDLLDKSYQLVLEGLSKKQQKEILAQACPIYQCSIHQNQYKGCGDCDSVPCDIWRKTKDPSFSEEEFEANIKQRIERLKGADNGI